jgi:hypothetical protein
LADTQLSADDTLSTAQVAAANPKGIPQAVDEPGGTPFDLSGAAMGGGRAQKAITDLQFTYKTNLKELSAGQKAEDERDARYRQRQEQMLEQEGASVQDLKGMGTWNAQEELAKHKTDLWSQFGSPGFVVAMLASAFTAQPMNSALNAGAAAMNAINEGDMNAYNKSFDAWKTNTNLALKRLDEEHREYADIEHLRSDNVAEWRAKMTGLLAKFGDERKLALLNNGYDEDLFHAIDLQQTSQLNVAKVRDQIDQNNMRTIWVNSQPGVWKQGPDGKKTANPAAWNEAMDAWNSMGNADKEAYHTFVRETWAKEGHSPSSEEILAFQKHQSESKYPYRIPATSQDVTAIKTQLESALGHPLSPGMTVALDSAYAAKGAGASRVIGSVNRAIEEIQRDFAAGKTEKEIDPDKKINEALLAGSMPGGRSAATAFINKIQLEHPDWGSDKINTAAALFTETQARARTLGVRSASVDAAVLEANKIANKVLQASEKVPRSNWVSLNELQRLVAQKTSSPAQKDLDTFTAGLITAYAQTMSRTGANTVTAQNRATELLDTAVGREAFERGVRDLQAEMEIVQQAVREIPADVNATSDKPNDPLGIR